MSDQKAGRMAVAGRFFFNVAVAPLLALGAFVTLCVILKAFGAIG